MSVLFPFRFYDGVVSECAVVCRLEVAGLDFAAIFSCSAPFFALDWKVIVIAD